MTSHVESLQVPTVKNTIKTVLNTKQQTKRLWPDILGMFPNPCNITPLQSNIVNIATCCLFASALFVALCWPRVKSVRRRKQPSSVCLPGQADTVAAAQTADSCISLASSICYLETSDFITADQCSCTLWLSPGLSALSVYLLVSHSLGLYLIGFWRAC